MPYLDTNGVDALWAKTKKYVAAHSSSGGSSAVIGSILMFAGETAPDGWLLCNGQAVSRTDYADLFAVIGVAYGSGDTSTTFNLPDLGGRVPVGVNDTYLVGGHGGSETHYITTDEMPSHNHTASTASAGAHTHYPLQGSSYRFLTYNYSGTSSTGVSERAVAKASSGNYMAPVVNSSKTDWQGATSTASAGAHTHTVTVNDSGGGEAMSLMQPYVNVNYIIYAGK